jgi:hypothetical protein
VWFSFYDLHRGDTPTASGNSQAQLDVAAQLGIDPTQIDQLIGLGVSYAQEIRMLLASERKVRNMKVREEIQAAKISALQIHRSRVVKLLGSDVNEKLQTWLDSEWRNRIQVLKIEPAQSSKGGERLEVKHQGD